MKFNDRNTALANRLRELVQRETETIGDGQAVAIAMFWSFVVDEAENRSADPEKLSRAHLESFIGEIAPIFRMHRVLRKPH